MHAEIHGGINKETIWALKQAACLLHKDTHPQSQAPHINPLMRPYCQTATHTHSHMAIPAPGTDRAG